jgi:hypothetical protein
MNPLLRNQIGYNEAILDESPSFDKFFRWADLITDKLGVSFTRKLDDFEALYWDFLYKGTSLTLSYNIFKSDYFENAAIAELVDALKDADPEQA